MRITVNIPDELGKEVKQRTDNVSAYVTQALQERLEKERRREAWKRLLYLAGKGNLDPAAYEINQKERRESNRSGGAA